MIGGRQGWARHHQNIHAERARGVEFAAHRLRAGILRHQQVYVFFGQKLTLIRLREGAARRDDLGVWGQLRWLRRLDTSNEIKMLRRRAERGQFLAADGKENSPRRRPESGDGGIEIGRDGPSISGFWLPGRTTEGKQRSSDFFCRGQRMMRNPRGEGMGRIDEGGDALGAEIGHHAGHTPETTQAMTDGRQNGQRRPPGERERGAEPLIPRQRARQYQRFPGATQNQDTKRGHFRKTDGR